MPQPTPVEGFEALDVIIRQAAPQLAQTWPGDEALVGMIVEQPNGIAVVWAPRDPTCTSAMACLVKCESNGGSGLACAEGLCSKPADQQTTNLFTCGSQQCATPCYMN